MLDCPLPKDEKLKTTPVRSHVYGEEKNGRKYAR